jgi:hypothetical protein
MCVRLFNWAATAFFSLFIDSPRSNKKKIRTPWFKAHAKASTGRERPKKETPIYAACGNMLKAKCSVLQILAAVGRSFAEAHLLGEFWSLHSRWFGCDYFLAHAAAAQAARARFSLCLQMLTFGIWILNWDMDAGTEDAIVSLSLPFSRRMHYAAVALWVSLLPLKSAVNLRALMNLYLSSYFYGIRTCQYGGIILFGCKFSLVQIVP